MMTSDERRRVFWLLKKYSSYTAWNALGEAYYSFADAYMQAMRTADFSDSDTQEWYSQHLKEILDGRINLEHGLPRLKQGDRNVWRANSRGVLAKSLDAIVFIDRILDPQEFSMDWMTNKAQVEAAHRELDLRTERLGAVTERESLDDSATMGQKTAFDNFFGPFNFPSALPEVPHPTTTVIDTGAEVPFDGIYEPEWGAMQDPANAGLIDKLKAAFSGKPSLMSKDDPQVGLATTRRAETGCMNYLLAHTQAPLYQDGELDKPMAVSWRLIWKDERYLDGVIPPEEVDYLAPGAQTPVQPLRCEAGQPCPREGFWFTPAKRSSRRHFQQGEVMPDFKSDWGSVVWQWDERQGE